MTFNELKDILISDNPSEQIKSHEKELFDLIPELKRCKGFDQHNEWHVYDVYEHTLHVIDGVPNDLTLRLAALFHDLGKPLTFTLDNKQVGHFYGHWNESLEIFKEYAIKFNLNPLLVKRVSTLIYYHDIPLDRVDDEALIKMGKQNIGPLYTLKRADLLAQNPKYHYLLKDYNEQEERNIQRIDRLNQERLAEILTSDYIKETIWKNMDYLLWIIPELKNLLGFQHNHPHHHLDVMNHTLLALEKSDNSFDIRLALLLHDIGKPHSYQDEEVRHFHGHAEVSAKMTKEILTRLGYSKEFIDEIEYLVRYHDTAITPEEIKDGDIELLLKRLHVQECDSKAHHPNYQEKRLNYIKKTKELIKERKA